MLSRHFRRPPERDVELSRIDEIDARHRNTVDRDGRACIESGSRDLQHGSRRQHTSAGRYGLDRERSAD
jgi:hypothetical protein